MADQEDAPQLNVSWVGLDDVPIVFGNQILVQSAGPNEVILILGQLAPPPVVGTAEQQREQLAEVPFVPVRPLLRMSITPDRLREFIAVMQVQLDHHDQLLKGMDPR